MDELVLLCEPIDKTPYIEAVNEMIQDGLIEAPVGESEMHIGFLPAHIRDELLRRAEAKIDEAKESQQAA